MSEQEKKNVQQVCSIYKELPDYLKGKIDGYAEAIKENRSDKDRQTTVKDT